MSTQKQGKKHRKNNDPSPTTFDNTHYRLIHKKKMDHSLLTTQKMKSQADLTGTCLKEEKTDEYQELVKQHCFQSLHSTFLNSNKASIKEVHTL
uniref:Putative ovule protein n=1 Tax=Solanum chacoense TaxID=4108 RepID=A0A0V0HXQ9_SOLCH